MPDLIALADLQTITKLNTLVEARKVDTSIEDAHIELEKVLGRTGYALVYANAPTFTAQAPHAATYVTLLTSYIKPWMAWKAKALATVDMYAEADKAGIFKKSGQDYEALSKGELGMVEAKATARADIRLERLLNYLCENTTVFTWYTTNVNGEERIDKTNSRSVGGVSFRISTRQSPNRG